MKKADKKKLWRQTLEIIKLTLSTPTFSTWFKNTFIDSISEEGSALSIEVACPSTFNRDTIETRYFGLVQSSLSSAVGKPVNLGFVIKQNLEDLKTEEEKSPLFEEPTDKGLPETLKKGRIRVGFTFENFAVSSSNQMAYAAAQAVAQTPSRAYNPLFIWGGVGVGKTHLMLAVGHSLLSQEKELKVLFCTGEDFTNDIVEGIRNKTTQVFRDKYRKLKVLLIDDVQFIAGKDTVQEEFFHTFNAVTSSGGQIVLTSDKPPSEISKLEERLRNRFEAGLSVDIGQPDFELRTAILLIKAKERDFNLPMDLAQLIAANVDSPRKLEGFLSKLISETQTKKTPLSPGLVQSLLGRKEVDSDKKIRVEPSQVITVVSKHYSLGKRELLSPLRARSVARPRQILMYLLRVDLGLPLQEVGRLIGGRDHTTVMHAVEKITTLNSSDEQIRRDIAGIKNNLYGQN